MSRPLKVYGWVGWHKDAPGPHRQTREIVAAHSKAEAMRLGGLTRREFEHSGCETGNEEELRVALAEPGVVFWHGYSEYRDVVWRRREPKP